VVYSAAVSLLARELLIRVQILVAAPRLPLFEYVEEKILPLNFLKKDYQNGISLLPIRRGV
jgi:hypothetical protein